MERELIFSHFVIDRQGLIFASARDARNKIYNYIVNSQTGNVLYQVNTRFEQLTGEAAETLRTRMDQYQSIVPTYRIPHFDFAN